MEVAGGDTERRRGKMSTGTRSAQRRARQLDELRDLQLMKDVLRDILNLVDDSPLERALVYHGLHTLEGLIDFERKDVRDLHVPDPPDPDHPDDPVDAEPLLLGLGAPLINWVAWMAYGVDHDESVLPDDIAVATRDQYLDFKNSREGRAYRTGTTISLPRSSTATKSPADEFRKGIRRDMNLFETFKNDAFEPWQ